MDSWLGSQGPHVDSFSVALPGPQSVGRIGPHDLSSPSCNAGWGAGSIPLPQTRTRRHRGVKGPWSRDPACPQRQQAWAVDAAPHCPCVTASHAGDRDLLAGEGTCLPAPDRSSHFTDVPRRPVPFRHQNRQCFPEAKSTWRGRRWVSLGLKEYMPWCTCVCVLTRVCLCAHGVLVAH